MDRKHNKKGQVQYFLENVFRIGFLMIALVAFFLLINFYIVNKFDTNRLQAEVIANRIMYSDTIMHVENSRTYTGIIELNKFDSNIISSDIDYLVKKHATVKMQLKDNKDKTEVKVAYLNEEQYNILSVIAKSQSEGKGTATKYDKVYPITYKNSSTGEYRYGTIYMSIIIPNS